LRHRQGEYTGVLTRREERKRKEKRRERRGEKGREGKGKEQNRRK
jgi:hypothetical protein